MAEQTIPILASKLSPSLSPELVERERILRAFEGMAGKRLALVVAGAGYGKTTAAAQAVAHQGMAAAWYNLDPSDRDLATFLTHLAAGLCRVIPGFGEGLLSSIAASRVSGGGGEALLAELAAELEEKAREQLAIVLDDFHLAQGNREIVEAVEYLLPRLPGLIHLIIISRVAPRVRVSTYRARGEVIEVTERELAFAPGEAEELCRRLAPERVDAEAAGLLHSLTGGWAAALVLMCGAARQGGGRIRQTIDGCSGESRERIFEYLEENFFSGLTPELQEFMLRTAPMDWLYPEMCDLLPGVSGSLDKLEHLSKTHMLTFPGDSSGRGWRYHHLLQDFLRETLARRHGPDAVAELNREIGALYEARGDKVNALAHHTAGRAHERVCGIISGLDLGNLVQFPMALLGRAIDDLPESELRGNARMLHAKAILASVRGDMQSAVEDIRKALELARKNRDEIGVMRVLRDLCFHHYLLGDVERGYRELLTLSRLQGIDSAMHGEMGGYLVFFASLLGRFGEADAHNDQALAHMANLSDPQAAFGRIWVTFCHAARYQLAGDFQASEAINARVMPVLEQAGMEVVKPIACVHAAIDAYYLRRPGEGVALTNKGIEIARRLGVYDHQYGWLLCTRGRSHLLDGDVAACLGDAHEADAVFKGLGNPYGQSTVAHLFGLAALARGDLRGAEDHFRKALDIVRNTGLVVWRGETAVELADALAVRERFAAAAEVLERHQESWSVSLFNSCRAYLLRALLHDRAGRLRESGESLGKALSLAASHRYDPWLLPKLEKLAHITSKHALPRELDAYLDSLLTRAGLEHPAGTPEPRASASSQAAAPLRLECLGRFRVRVGEREIPHQAWRNTKAARIFLALALGEPGEFAPKDRLLEIAWPEQDPEVTGKRFHVALSYLRRVFEPDLRRGRPSAYVIRQGEAYAIDFGEGGGSDVGDFTRAIGQARELENSYPDQAFERLRRAEGLYRGDLAPAAFQEDWFEDLRIRLQNQYLMALSRIMARLEERGEWAACVACAEKYLAVEAYAEPAYCTLMRCHAALGDPALARKAFDRCEKRISKELGYPLSSDSLSLYKSLVPQH